MSVPLVRLFVWFSDLVCIFVFSLVKPNSDLACICFKFLDSDCVSGLPMTDTSESVQIVERLKKNNILMIQSMRIWWTKLQPYIYHLLEASRQRRVRECII